jgi:hypothetical protein
MALVQAMPLLPVSSQGEPQCAGQAQVEMRHMHGAGARRRAPQPPVARLWQDPREVIVIRRSSQELRVEQHEFGRSLDD